MVDQGVVDGMNSRLLATGEGIEPGAGIGPFQPFRYVLSAVVERVLFLIRPSIGFPAIEAGEPAVRDRASDQSGRFNPTPFSHSFPWGCRVGGFYSGQKCSFHCSTINPYLWV